MPSRRATEAGRCSSPHTLVLGLVEAKLDDWKRKLIDLTRRNRLIHFQASRATTVRVVGELPPEIFRMTVLRRTAMTFIPRPEDEDEARDILREAPGIMVIDKREDGGYVTPVECVGDFATFISRIRQDSTIENGLNLWCVSDNLRKGAALNAVQIAEVLGQRVLKKG